jgi:hypothetical protein
LYSDAPKGTCPFIPPKKGKGKASSKSSRAEEPDVVMTKGKEATNLYCECCCKMFKTDAATHDLTPQHQAFMLDDSNYKAFDAYAADLKRRRKAEARGRAQAETEVGREIGVEVGTEPESKEET